MFAEKEGYDRGITIFSPDGRLYQVEYARQAVEQGNPAIGLRLDDEILLATLSSHHSPLVTGGDTEKLHSIDDHIAAASAGHAADARQLVDIARERAQRERLQYGESIPVERLVTAIGDHIQEHTQAGGVRPYGTSLLVGGYDSGPSLFEIDPSGAVLEWQADAVGDSHEEIVTVLEDDYQSGMTEDEAFSLVGEALQLVDDAVSTSDISLGRIGNSGFETIAADRVGSFFSKTD